MQRLRVSPCVALALAALSIPVFAQKVREEMVPMRNGAKLATNIYLPDGDKAWFLKVVGPAAAVTEQEQAINDFFASVRTAPDKPHPDWKLPAGWEERAGSGMRVATISILPCLLPPDLVRAASAAMTCPSFLAVFGGKAV